MTRWNTGLAQGNTETNELGYKSGLKRVLAFSECSISPLRASITMAAYFGFAKRTIGAVTQNKKESNNAPTRAGETCLRLKSLSFTASCDLFGPFVYS